MPEAVTVPSLKIMTSTVSKESLARDTIQYTHTNGQNFCPTYFQLLPSRKRLWKQKWTEPSETKRGRKEATPCWPESAAERWPPGSSSTPSCWCCSPGWWLSGPPSRSSPPQTAAGPWSRLTPGHPRLHRQTRLMSMTGPASCTTCFAAAVEAAIEQCKERRSACFCRGRNFSCISDSTVTFTGTLQNWFID